MPQIPQYESQVNPSGDDTSKQANGSEVTIGSGLQAMGQGLEQAGAGLKSYQDHHETIMGAAKFSDFKLQNETDVTNLTQSFDPDDPDFKSKFEQKYQDGVDSITSQMSSIQAAEYISKKADTYKAALWESMLHKNAQLIRQETGVAVKAISTNLTASAYNNPDLMDANIDQIDDLIKKQPNSNQLTDAAHESIKAQVARAVTIGAGQGMVRDDPDGLLDELNKGNKFSGLDAADQANLRAKAESAIRANDRTAELNQKKAENIEKKQQLANFQDLHHQIDEGQMDFKTIDQLWTQKKISDTQYEIATNRLQKIMDGTQVGDDSAFMDAQSRIRKGEITNFEDLTAQYGLGKGKGLSQQHLQFLSKTFLEPKNVSRGEDQMWGAVMDQAQKKLIQPTFVPWGDRPGMNLYAKALTSMRNDYDAQIAAGKSPKELLDPASKDYVGKAIDTYARSRNQLSAQARDAYGPSPVNSTPVIPVGSDRPLPNEGAKAAPSPHAPAAAVNPKAQAALETIISRFPKKGGS